MPNRYICDVLDEMRSSYKTYNFAAFKGLIEECQSLANRMEAALYDQADARDLTKEVRALKQEKRRLEFEVDEKKWELEELMYKVKCEKSRANRDRKQQKRDDDGSLPSGG